MIVASSELCFALHGGGSPIDQLGRDDPVVHGKVGIKRFKSWQYSLLIPRGESPMKHAVCAHVVFCPFCCDASVLVAVSAHVLAASATESAQERSSRPFCDCVDLVACVNLQSVFPSCVALGVVAVLGVARSAGHDVSSDVCLS